MDYLESDMINTVNISEIGWDVFYKENVGDYLLYSIYNDSTPIFVSRVSIPNIEDLDQRFYKIKTVWIIEKYPRIDGGDDIRFDGEFLDREGLILKLAKEYPGDLAWLLFHPEWLND